MTEYAKTHKSWILSLFLAALLAAGVWVLLGAARDDNGLDSSQLNAFCGPGHAKNGWHRKHPNRRGHHTRHHHKKHHRNCPEGPGPNQPLPTGPVTPTPNPTVTVTPTPNPTVTVTPTPTPTPTPSCTTFPGGYNSPPTTICTTPSP